MGALHSKLERAKHVNLAEHFCKGCQSLAKGTSNPKINIRLCKGFIICLLVSKTKNNKK
jgi:Pyruvate/2-oxoacid:ferredoxin oxidoreductase delta subunit